MGRKWISGQKEEGKRCEQKTDFLLLFKCAIYKNLLAIDLIMKKTHLSLVAGCFAFANTTNIPVFKYIFCAVQFLVCLDFVFLILYEKKKKYIFGCGDMHNIFVKTHTSLHLCTFESLGRGKW